MSNLFMRRSAEISPCRSYWLERQWDEALSLLVTRMLSPSIYLGAAQHGAPKHPMARDKHRIPRDQQRIIWRATA